MSYDMQVWSVVNPDWRQIAAGIDGWNISEHFLTFQKASWQIVVGPRSRVEEEDIPEDVFRSLPGIQFVTEMNLEPIHAPEAAHKMLQRMAARIAKDSYGVVLDPQQDTITSPRGVKRIIHSKQYDRISVLNFAWWFNESPLIEQGGFIRLLSTLEKYLPEALPRRYGKYEPPQYQYETQGKDHFVEFISNETLGVVWYPHYPVLSVWLGVYGGFGPRRQGYRTNSLYIDVDASAWAQPGWDIALRRFWYEMSDFIHPFFGEVRVLSNYLLQRGRLVGDRMTDRHPIRNGWWNGVPKRLGSAVVIDRRYAELWTKFVKRSEQRNSLYFISSDDWISEKRVDRLVGGVPRGIAQGEYSQPPPRLGRTTYPRMWPFEYPFSDD